MNEGKTISLTQILLPIVLVSITLCLFFAFQMNQIMRDRDTLASLKSQQEASFQESIKLEKQLGGLVAGTQKLADSGNANAKEVIAKLVQAGILVPPKVEGMAPVTPRNPPVPAK